jgi:hypothetical protein
MSRTGPDAADQFDDFYRVALYAFVPGGAEGPSDDMVEVQLAREFAKAAVG